VCTGGEEVYPGWCIGEVYYPGMLLLVYYLGYTLPYTPRGYYMGYTLPYTPGDTTWTISFLIHPGIPPGLYSLLYTRG